MIDWNRLPERANADGEFRYAARAWSATLRLDVGDDSRALRIEDGVVTGVEAVSPDADADAFVRAPAATWSELLAETPRPFYQDLTGAALHHGVELPEDPLAYAAYYPALRRIVQLLRDAKGEED